MRLFKALVQVINDGERKPLGKIVFEMFYYTLINRELPSGYLTALLYQRDAGSVRDYLSHRQLMKITTDLFDSKNLYRPLNDKKIFSQVLTRHDIATPRILGYTSARYIHYGSQQGKLRGVEDLQRGINRLMATHRHEDIFAKPVNGRLGQGTFKLLKNESGEEVKSIYAQLDETDFLFQETIHQHPAVKEMYSHSVNTLRVHTHIKPRSGEVEIVSALMRFGAAGSVVDNGAIFVPIDLTDWTLAGNGKTAFFRGGRTLTSHPDTGKIFYGFEIPYGLQVQALVEKVSRLFDRTFIAWDIAITPNGPVIVEGNQTCGLTTAQIAAGGFRANRSFMKLFWGV